MKKKITEIKSEIKETNSSFGKYVLEVVVECSLNGKTWTVNDFKYSWTKKALQDFVTYFESICPDCRNDWVNCTCEIVPELANQVKKRLFSGVTMYSSN